MWIHTFNNKGSSLLFTAKKNKNLFDRSWDISLWNSRFPHKNTLRSGFLGHRILSASIPICYSALVLLGLRYLVSSATCWSAERINLLFSFLIIRLAIKHDTTFKNWYPWRSFWKFSHFSYSLYIFFWINGFLNLFLSIFTFFFQLLLIIFFFFN